MNTPATEMFDKAQADYARMNESFRQMAEKSVAQSADAYEKFKTIAEEATATAQKSFDAMREGMTVLSTRAMENARVNTEAGVAHVEKLTRAKSFAELLELQGEFFRSAFDTLSAQSKEAQELTAKVAQDATAPVKAQAEKATAEVTAAMKAAADEAPKAAARAVKTAKAA